MTERARIIEIRGTTAKVECFDTDSCDSCSSAFCSTTARTYRAAIDPDVPASIGDQVEVHVPPSRAIGAGFLVLFFPLLVFVAAYLAFGFLDNEAAQVGAGLGGLVLGFGLVYLFGKNRQHDLPRITRVLSDPDFVPERLQRSSV